MAKRRKNDQNAKLGGIIGMLLVILAVLLAVALTPPAQPEPTDPPVLQNPTTEATPAVTEPTPSATEPTWPLRTGWAEMNGDRFYFESGAPVKGPCVIDGSLYCFGEDGALLGAGWQELGEERYYLNAEGIAQTGWLELEGNKYFLRENGTAARGEMEIDGQKHWFTSTGAEILLVNPWNYLPKDYTVELIELDDVISRNTFNHRVSSVCYDALVQMMTDVQALGYDIKVTSSYRTQGDQEYLYERQVQKQMALLGCSREEAEKVAATISAIPGTSEHQLGLAVDIAQQTPDWGYSLGEIQETLPGQQWLFENSWRYGFVLRYPNGKTEETGIIYEPWHYRYVGLELAAELHELGVTLEAYLAGLTER